MAVLADGVQYGLSAHGLSSENKSLVFVKLTDSSFKAIEEYLRIKLKTAQHPTVQFLGNEGAENPSRKNYLKKNRSCS
ncbi:putative RNA polymerase II elongation factor ELL [Daphnia magna]|uniref:Putative RNA polymerase II elongation factor ELL n=1 Tax=Daphnia magna TaxID=35525 RepID=A0A164W097_9CRUS|nr:putative RNA polymerase II elongation factor ELL [Daphnia magna]